MYCYNIGNRSNYATKEGRNMNTNLFKAAIAKKGLTQARLAQQIGISANTLSKKINGKSDFVIWEVVAITNALELKNPQEIFFD